MINSRIRQGCNAALYGHLRKVLGSPARPGRVEKIVVSTQNGVNLVEYSSERGIVRAYETSSGIIGIVRD